MEQDVNPPAVEDGLSEEERRRRADLTEPVAPATAIPDAPAEQELPPGAVRDAEGNPLSDWDARPIGAISNRTIFTGDNLNVLRGVDSDSVDLIYLDPPFNSNAGYAAPTGSKTAGAAFIVTWTPSDIDLALHDQLEHEHPALHAAILGARETAGNSTMNYLLMMAPRLLEMRRVLKPTGSIYLHCDPTESHYLKQLLDAIFGRDNFRNEIIWRYPPKGNGPKLGFHRKHDMILYYGKSRDGVSSSGDETVSARAASQAALAADRKGTGRWSWRPAPTGRTERARGRPNPF